MNQNIFKAKTENFKLSISDLKDKMTKLLKMCDSTDFKQNEAFETLQDGLVNLLELKYFNADTQKDYTNKEKEKSDEKNLDFQNYLYEKNNITSQINSCINYPTLEMDKINMPKNDLVIEYYENKGISLSKEELKTMDTLKYELEVRKELDEKVKGLIKQIKENSSHVKEKEKFLKSLPDYFENLETNTLKAQNFLNLKITEKNKKINLSDKLPPPLFVLFNSLECIDTKLVDFEINIQGKKENVEEFYENYNLDNVKFEVEKSEENLDNREEGEHSDEGEINDEEFVKVPEKITPKLKFRRKNKNLKKRKLTDYENFPKIKKFPLYLQLKIKKIANGNLDFPIIINFYFIPIFNVITCQVVTNDSNFKTSHLLSNIFMPPPNLLSKVKKEINLAIDFLCEDYSDDEKVYNYIQILSNNVNYSLSYLKKLSLHILRKNTDKYKDIDVVINQCNEIYLDDPNKINVENFIEILSQRLIFLPSLLQQTDYLTTHKSFLNEAYDEISKEKRFQLCKQRCSITNVTYINQDEYLNIFHTIFSNSEVDGDGYAIPNDDYRVISVFEKDEEDNYFKRYVKVPISCYEEDECIYLKVTIMRNGVTLNLYIEVGFDYPINNPKFLLHIPNNLISTVNVPSNLEIVANANKTVHLSSTTEIIHFNALRDIEEEVNLFFNEFCSDNNIKYLLSFQIRNVMMCFDILLDIESSKVTALFSKSFKGVKKKRPFRFNNLNNILNQDNKY